MGVALTIASPSRNAVRGWLPSDGQVHVWVADLDKPAPGDGTDLCDEERERAARFKFDRDRHRFVAARSTLRWLLGRCLDTAPSEVAFEYSPHGKPRVLGTNLAFNLSHSGNSALFALSPGFDVGVDVEMIDHAQDNDELVASRFFSPREVSALFGLPRAARREAFLRCWTRKEAFIKARGDGLSLGLQDFAVSFGPGEPPALLWTSWASQEPLQWRLHDLTDVHRGWVAAVAARTDELTVVLRGETAPASRHYRREHTT